MIKKTYIPGKPRNPKLSTATGTSGVGKTEFNQVAGSSHEHYNKGVLDQITEAMLIGALRDMITSTDEETELTDENILSALRVLSEISKANADLLEDIKSKFLSKIEPDTAQKLITFTEGIEVGDFTTGALGAGAAIKMIDGTSFAEVDHLTVRQKATFRELIIEALKHIGGQLVLTPARMKCVRVVDGGSFYKCYFDTGDGEVSNEFVEGDLARCQVFTGNGTKFYWRLVTLVGEDWINLSKTSAAEGSDAPEAGDDIVQLGNATDTTRQSAIILSTVGADAPSWKQYSGINSFSLEGKETTVFSKLGNRIQGKTVFTSGGTNLDDHLDGVAQDILDALQAAQDAEDKAQQAIEDAEANVGLINTEIGKLQAQLDGEVSNWFYPYSPTLANYPASDWTTNEIKDRHIGDTFTNTAQAPATDAGKSWRFVKNGSTYSWTLIADSDAVKALLKAAEAQATADGKSTTFLIQPTKYHLGDMWVLNSDQTINGIAYKEGDILTATQDSTTYNQAHWVKRVRYTDDTAIDNLEIGGRNLILNTSNKWETKTVVSYGTTLGLIPINDDWRGKTVTHSFEVKDIPEGESVRIRIDFWRPDNTYITPHYGNIVNLAGKSFVSYIVPTDTQYNRIRARVMPVNYTSDYNVLFKCEKLEFGNKATDWTPAPEDVQAEINTAKQEALTAAGNAQTTANSLKNFTDTAFRDGIIDRSESIAIEKYKNSLNEAMSKAEASYDKVYTNTYLEGTAKTNLLNAKINLWGQRDTLLSAINTAISGGTTTPAQKTAVDNAFSTFNNLMAAFQNALEEANKAIQTKLDDLSTEKVNNLEIVGRNLIDNSGIKYTIPKTPHTTTVYTFNEDIEAGEKLTFSAKKTDGYIVFNVVQPSGNLWFGELTTLRNTYTRTVPQKISKGETLSIYTHGTSDETTVDISELMIVRGEKAVRWDYSFNDKEGIGKNLLNNSLKSYKLTSSQTTTDYEINDNIQKGELLTFSFTPDIQEGYRVVMQVVREDGSQTWLHEFAGSNLITKRLSIDLTKGDRLLLYNHSTATASSVTVSKFMVSRGDTLGKWKVSEEDNIEIGGRNLALNTSAEWKPLSWTNWYWTGNFIKYTEAKPNEIYTISIHLRNVEDSLDGAFRLYVRWLNEEGVRDGSSANGSLVYDEGISKATFTIPEGKYGFEASIRSTQRDSTKSCEYRMFKAEKGNKATGWTPAPEDVEAQIDAEKNRINEILSDNIADPSEKQYLSNLWQEIYAEYPRIWAQANDYSVSKTTYEQKYTALKNILDPVLANLTINSTVSGSSIRTAFSQYYDARTALQNAITNKVNQNAVDADAKAAEAQAKANKSAAITDKFKTTIDGGLINTVMMLLREANSTIDTAGISGIQDNGEGVAFWAGGTHGQAIANLAKVIIRHDGSGQLAGGDISWAPGEPTRFRGVIELLSSLGKVGIIDSGLVTSGGQISEDILETLTQLAAGYSVSITPQSSWTDSYVAGRPEEYAHAYTQNIVVTEDSSLEFWVSFGRTYTGWNETYDIYVEDVNAGVLEYTRRKFSSTINYVGGNYSIPVRAGTYKIHAKITGTGGLQSGQVLSVTLKGKNEATNITAVGFKQKTKIGIDGFFSYWGEDNYLYYQKDNGFKSKMGSTKWDTPGVLAKGRIASNGARDTTKAWGAKNSTSSVTKPSGTGSYRVPVNCPNADYDVNISPRTANRLFYVGATTATYFEVYFQDRSGVAQDSDFSYTLVGNNY